MNENPHPKSPPFLHQGPDHSAPYPVSRLATAFHPSDLDAELTKTDLILSARTAAKLQVIADQIQTLQQAPRQILAAAQEEQALNQVQCAFKRIPGKTYHLYDAGGGRPYFSQLSHANWGGQTPHRFLGTYRLEPDYSWTSAAQDKDPESAGGLVRPPLGTDGVPPASGGG